MSEVLLRQWAMLRLIPKHPRRIDTATLSNRLEAEGYQVNRRTIQRDLLSLSEVFPLAVDDRDKPYGWSWMKGAQVMDIPGMDPPAALAFQLAQAYLGELLPPAALAALTPHFKRAREVLDHSRSGRLRLWPNKVRIIGRGPRLIPPKISPVVHDSVCQALLDNMQIEVRYRKRGAPQPILYAVHPLGLVFRQGIVYLVCTLWNYDDIRQLAVHRISSVRSTQTRARHPPRFTLDGYIAGGAFGYPVSDKTLRLRARFSRGAAAHLFETPLSNDQRLSQGADGTVTLAATVADTAELRWWLLGFGAGAEVLSPKRLRMEFQRVAGNMARRYSGP